MPAHSLLLAVNRLLKQVKGLSGPPIAQQSDLHDTRSAKEAARARHRGEG